MPNLKSPRPRTEHVAFFLDKEDAENLSTLAKAFGLRARGSLITWIIENLLNDGFSPIGGARVCAKILKARKKADLPNTFDFAQLIPRELPDFPDVTLTAEDIDKAIRELEAEKRKLSKGQK